MSGLSGATAIVGVAETRLGKVPELGCMQMCVQAAHEAAAEAGIKMSDIDAVLTVDSMAEPFRMHSVVLSEYLGIRPRYSMTNSLGGATHCAMVSHAAAALHAGLCDTVLIATSDKLVTGLTKDQAIAALAENAGHAQYERPYGPMIPAMYALAANRYMHQYGVTPEQMAEVAVVHRRHAGMHPNAQEKTPITREDVLASKPVAMPLRVLDCSLVSDGGGAIIMTRADRARDLKQTPVFLLGVGERHLNEFVHQAPDLTTCGAKDSGEQAFRMAGLAPKDMDVAMLYDCFTITVLLLLEDLGFCPRGEAGAFVESGAIALGGALPVNTHGGLLSHGHPGRPGGVFHIIEAVRQLRGRCDARQVQDAARAFVHGNGGILSTHCSLILGRD